MDRSRYTQRVDTSQIQADLQNAVTDADMLLNDFKKEAVDELRNNVQMVVWQSAQEMEKRLSKTLANNYARGYQQLYESLSAANKSMIDSLGSQLIMQQRWLTTQQQKLEKKLRIRTIFLIVLAGVFAVTIVVLFVLLFRLK